MTRGQGSLRAQARREARRQREPKPYRFVTDGLRRLVRVVVDQASGLERLSRAQLRRGRRCVGCEENDGHRLEPVLGWICEPCDEVIELVYEKEIEEVQEAREKVQAFLDAMGRAG